MQNRGQDPGQHGNGCDLALFALTHSIIVDLAEGQEKGHARSLLSGYGISNLMKLSRSSMAFWLQVVQQQHDMSEPMRN
jgi:hypothetical protein